MQTEQIVALLVAERDRLNRAIEALQGSGAAKRRGRPPAAASGNSSSAAKSRGRRSFSPAQRKAQAERMKAYWAARRKQQAQKSK